MSYYTKITKAGLTAITAAINNKFKVPITYMAFGDGNGYVPVPNENATSLVNEVYRVGVNKVEIHSKNPNWIVCEAIIPSAVGGFNIREVALYDSTGNTMLAIASYPPTYKPTVEEGAAKIQTIRVVLQVENTGNFELIIDPDIVLATEASLKKIDNKKITIFDDLDQMSNTEHPFEKEFSFVKGFNGGFFQYNKSKANISNGFNIIEGWERHVNFLQISPLAFGADPTGQRDSTEAFQKWSEHLTLTTYNQIYPPVGLIDAGYYIVDDITLEDLSNCSIISLGAVIYGNSTTKKSSILKIKNAMSLRITGSLTLHGWNNENYETGLLITAADGSRLDPAGIANHIDIIGLTARNLVCGFQIGEDLQNYDKHVAELHFIGCNTIFCRTSVRNYGSQTESSFDGCTLASGYFDETDSNVYHSVLDIRGGIVEITGGSLVNSMLPKEFSNHVGIDIKPAKSIKYKNPYPVVSICGTHIELTSKLINIGHGGLTNTNSKLSSISILGCKGWISPVQNTELIRVWDPNFIGKISVDPSSNFYTSEQRTVHNVISDSVQCVLNISPLAFGENMRQGLGSIVGGKTIHGLKHVTRVHALSQTLIAGINVIKFNSYSGEGDLSRYSNYNHSTGEIKLKHSAKTLKIELMIDDNAITVNGDIYLKKNNNIIAKVLKVGSMGLLIYTDSNILESDVYTIVFENTSPTQFGSGVGSYMDLYMET